MRIRRGTIFVILFALIAGGIVAASQFLRAQPPLDITIAVTPLAETWIRDAVTRFNADETVVNAVRRVRINLTVVDDLQAWLDERARWSAQSHPDAWLASTIHSVEYAREARIPFDIVQTSVARTPLVWGGFTNAVSDLTASDTLAFDWATVAENANAGGSDRINLAFPHPARSIGGLGVVFSAAAAFTGSEFLDSASLNGANFRAWMQPILDSVPNFVTLGASPARTLAARGQVAGEVGILPESEWLMNISGQLINPGNPLRLSYPAYPFVFDFPLARWAGGEEPNSESAANAADITAGVNAFAAYLMGETQQNNAQAYGLRPSDGIVQTDSGRFFDAQPYGILLTPPLDTPAQPPPRRSDIQSLVTWINNVTP